MQITKGVIDDFAWLTIVRCSCLVESEVAGMIYANDASVHGLQGRAGLHPLIDSHCDGEREIVKCRCYSLALVTTLSE